MDRTEEMREYFANDIFAVETVGIKIDSAGDGEAECSLELGPEHMNALGTAMGGAIFTLADFAIAVAANSESLGSVSLTSQVTYLSAARGKKLFAHARCIKSGRSTSSYITDVTTEDGTLAASVTGTCFKKKTIDR
ncbi:MAG: PaaI family thioesterase [Oscillospiraceae bacterium]|nr:PaaI family thioesterase [Oscillospiraceae bacterium]